MGGAEWPIIHPPEAIAHPFHNAASGLAVVPLAAGDDHIVPQLRNLMDGALEVDQLTTLDGTDGFFDQSFASIVFSRQVNSHLEQPLAERLHGVGVGEVGGGHRVGMPKLAPFH